MKLLDLLVFFVIFTSTNGVRPRLITSAVKVDSPVWSLSTRNEDLTTNLNIVTYTSPLSIHSNEVWALSLYKGTLSLENFQRRGVGILQHLLIDHLDTIPILGKQSGRRVDKCAALERLGHSLLNVEKLADVDVGDAFAGVKVIERSPVIVCLESLPGHEAIDVGDHFLFLCRKIASFQLESLDNKSRLLGTEEMRRFLNK